MELGDRVLSGRWPGEASWLSGDCEVKRRRLWGPEALTQAGPAAHSVPADVLGEGAETSQGSEWECRCLPSETLPGTCQQRPVGEGLPLPSQRLRQVRSRRQDLSHREGTSSAPSTCIPGTPRLGLAIRSLVGWGARPQAEGRATSTPRASVRCPDP